ncbi:glycosyltransferase [Myxococcus sp. RHSTA-1-4]|uniref:glycosyltransferase n=1 Tax=Myxococcus sp. RHSTA-1-4 TaxID=2874601 RepID=UPI001CBD09FD|nr:glycosyltransferase [Myxococcus sp. RHSTA-1-4]MBZ4417568.1 glycosyltransferase [Myxococcus sp. RHSTA-1-4]
MSAQPPRFSVVIPCFNQGAFLAEALDSLRAQTLPPHEIIVVDDGSTDPYSVQRMDELCVGGVKLVRQENRGLSGARNSGIRASTGDWILPLDADDRLAPNALESYASAIAASPEVDVWYPDIQHFGMEALLWESPPFNPWRQLWENQMVCSSAIRRTVFDAGVFYNERMRQGYEDWEFYIHACVERGFQARVLERVIFRYRRWGYSMLSESNSRQAELLEQLHRERPIYQDEERLQELKRQRDPYLAIAAASEALRPALETQALKDFRLVDESGRVQREGSLAPFQGHPFARLLVSLDDVPLAAALRADPFFLEKVAHVFQEQRPAMLWLVTTSDPGQAWPGNLLPEREVQADSLRCVGFGLHPSFLVDGPPIPRTDAGLLEDLDGHMGRLAPGSVAFMVVGSWSQSETSALTPWVPTANASMSAALQAEERRRLVRQGLQLVGQGTSKLVRGVIGERPHDKLLSVSLTRQVKSRLLSQAAASSTPSQATATGVPVSDSRPGPFASWQLDTPRQRQALLKGLHQPPRFDKRPLAGEPALMIITPWVVHGGVDRALVDLLHGLRRVAPHQRRYLVTTINAGRPTVMAWADEVLPLIDGAFCVPDVAPHTPHDFIAGLAKRLGVGAVLIANSQMGFDSLPKLRQLEQRVRVISQAHTFPKDPVTGELFGHCAYSASRYNNLIDGYAAICQDTVDGFVQKFYVSPTKTRIVFLGVDTERFGAAYRRRFVAGERPRVLWLGRLAPEKDPLMCLKVAELWKQRHGSERLGFHITGSGSEEAALREYVRQKNLGDVVTMEPAVGDTVPQYRSADCLLMTSQYEGIPVVIYEAMAAGLPVVASVSNTSIPAVLPAEDAWFIHRQSEPADYVAALEEMLANPDEVRARGERLKKSSERFGLVRYAQEMMEMLFPEPRQQPLRRVVP